MSKFFKLCILSISIVFLLAGCGQSENKNAQVSNENKYENAVNIVLSDEKILVDGEQISEQTTDAVYKAKDIVFYLEDQGFTYGEGTEADEHSKEEADKHTVVHITKPGTYVLSGNLSYGQVAIDLGEDAKKDENAVVNLVLNGVDIHCDVAPAVIFYNVYECGDDDAENATKDVDTSKAGANVIIADDTVNNVTGSHVARIYESYELNEDGTEVVDSKKLHKYDAAFYSKRSMNVGGEEEGTGVLNIVADNEGLDSELHLTINGGNIYIESGNDGINTNEDGVSVTTINGGTLEILVNGSTGEGDGIDSNGWLVINGGTVIAQACSDSGDAGIDSDMGIHLNGGTVIATGNMLDRFGESSQNYAVFSFAQRQKTQGNYALKNADNEAVFTFTNDNEFTYLVLAGDELVEGDYTLWCDEKQCEGSSQGSFGMGRPGENGDRGEGFGGGAGFGDGTEFSGEGEMPKPEDDAIFEGMENGEIPEKPEGMERPEMEPMQTGGEKNTVFAIVKGANQFQNVTVINS